MPEVSQPLTAGTEHVAHVLSLEYDNVEGLNEFLAHSEHSVVGESPPHLLLSLPVPLSSLLSLRFLH